MNLTVAVIQEAIGSNDKTKNLEATSEKVRKAALAGAKLVLLQELHTTQYFCQVQDPAIFDLAEPMDGPSRQHLEALAKELNIVLVGSIFEKRTAGVFHNTALVFDGQEGLVGYYRKMHIPDDPGFSEKYYFTPGDQKRDGQNPFKPIQTSVGKLGVLVCWDQWYPEAARLAALQGAQILLYPTAIGWDPEDTAEEQTRQRDAWTLIQRSHAVANHLPVLVANRTGFEYSPDETKPELGTQFWGQSFIAGQQGDILAMSDTNDEGPLLANIDLGRTDHLRRIWPYFRDRRVDAYEGLLQRYMD
ncbi:MAG: carbon-nitrogen hydrolase [Pseudomonadota bacterium]|nr:carbon-nitrogen hydrolase [Pseudomonadota bacterium]